MTFADNSITKKSANHSALSGMLVCDNISSFDSFFFVGYRLQGL